jgi:hypothetical protein
LDKFSGRAGKFALNDNTITIGGDMDKHYLTPMQENKLRSFVGLWAGRYETHKEVLKFMGADPKKVDYEKIFKMFSDKAMEMMANPDADPFYTAYEINKIFENKKKFVKKQ